MCTANCIIYGVMHLSREDVVGKRVVEVGAYNVNGSLRSIFKSYRPAEYIGVDIMAGPGVDVVCDAEQLVATFGEGRFDIVVSTEMLEHVRNWRLSIANMKRLCAPGGLILITTRSKGFGYHAYPHDYWRYEVDDMRKIFSDCTLEDLRPDPEVPGVFLRARKLNRPENDLSHIELYSIIADRRVKDVDQAMINAFIRRRQIRKFFGDIVRHAKSLVP